MRKKRPHLHLVGYLIAGSIPRPDGVKLRLFMIALFAGFGIMFVSFGIITSTWVDVVLLFLLSMGNGFIVVLLMTWMQTRTPQEMLGRIMALLKFSSTGLAPISQAISGVLSKWNLTLLFVIPGKLILLVAGGMAFHPDLKAFSESLSAAPVEG